MSIKHLLTFSTLIWLTGCESHLIKLQDTYPELFKNETAKNGVHIQEKTNSHKQIDELYIDLDHFMVFRDNRNDSPTAWAQLVKPIYIIIPGIKYELKQTYQWYDNKLHNVDRSRSDYTIRVHLILRKNSQGTAVEYTIKGGPEEQPAIDWLAKRILETL